MKTFRFVGMVLMAVLMCVNFAACSDDDDEGAEGGKNYKELIVGTWLYGGAEDMITVFYSNGTGVTMEDGQTAAEGDAFKWSLSDATLTVTFDADDSRQMTIKELTETKLVIEGYDEETGERYAETYLRK